MMTVLVNSTKAELLVNTSDLAYAPVMTVSVYPIKIATGTPMMTALGYPTKPVSWLEPP